MLQQTQVKTVIPYWERWLRELPTIAAAAQAPSAKIHKLWEGLGYYTRVRNLQKAAQIVVKKHAGNFPNVFEEVLALPGIGRYTAGAICSIAFNQARPILDGNVIRVLTRVFGIADDPKEKQANERLWRLAEELVNRAKTQSPHRGSLPAFAVPAPVRENNSCSFLNQSLMELGALLCTPRNAQCQVCPVKRLCVAFKENRVGSLPNPGRRAAATTQRFMALAIERNGRFLVRQRPAGVVNAHLWEFPNGEVMAAKADPQMFLKNTFGIVPGKIKPLGIVKHSITRYRITLETFLVQFDEANSTSLHSHWTQPVARETRPSGMIEVWKTPAQLRGLAFTAAHKKLASTAAKSILSDR